MKVLPLVIAAFSGACFTAAAYESGAVQAAPALIGAALAVTVAAMVDWS